MTNVDLVSFISSDLFNGVKIGIFLLGSAFVLRETVLALLDLLGRNENVRNQDSDPSK